MLKHAFYCFMAISLLAASGTGQTGRKRDEVPRALLNQLMRDDAEVRTMLREGYDPEIHGFSVEHVDLNNDKKPELFVTAPGGNSSAPIWIYRRTARGYQMLLKAAFMGYRLLKTSSNGYRDLEMSYGGNAMGYDVDVYKFDGRKYVLKSNKHRRGGSGY